MTIVEAGRCEHVAGRSLRRSRERSSCADSAHASDLGQFVAFRLCMVATLVSLLDDMRRCSLRSATVSFFFGLLICLIVKVRFALDIPVLTMHVCLLGELRFC